METSKISAMILEAFPVAEFVIDDDHRITHWNRACEILTNVPRQTIVGTSNQWQPFYSTPRMVMADLVLRHDGNKLADDLYPGKVRHSQIIPGTYEASDFFPRLGENGGRWLYFTATPLCNDHGTIIGAIETLRAPTKPQQMLEHRDAGDSV